MSITITCSVFKQFCRHNSVYRQILPFSWSPTIRKYQTNSFHRTAYQCRRVTHFISTVSCMVSPSFISLFSICFYCPRATEWMHKNSSSAIWMMQRDANEAQVQNIPLSLARWIRTELYIRWRRLTHSIHRTNWSSFSQIELLLNAMLRVEGDVN